MIPVSVAIITRDEERNIGEALESVKDFEDIVVVDAYSTDGTAAVCKRYTERVFQREWMGYARQKQTAVDLAERPWVLILDADERVTEGLRAEIGERIKDSVTAGFYIPRKNFFLGRWIRHGGWWPDHALRLFLKGRSFVEERAVHEKVVVNGPVGYLNEPLEHYTYRTLSDYLVKMERYSTLSASELSHKTRVTSAISMAVNPSLTFLKMFLLRQGFRDGIHGFVLALLYGFSTFLKYAKAWESLTGNEGRPRQGHTAG